MGEDQIRMTVGEHIHELRHCLLRALLGVLVGMVGCFFLRKGLFQVISWPLAVATGGNPPHMYYLSPSEAFTTLVKVCLVTGAILSSPYGLHQMWRFIAAGLYEKERKAVRRYLLPSIVLFAVGVAFFFVVVAPLVLRFFIVFAQQNFPQPPTWMVDWLGDRVVSTAPAGGGAAGDGYLQPALRLSEYVSFVAVLSLVFGLGFQTPLVVLFLARSGIVPIAVMRRFRRYVLLIILILSAIITPPDWVSMVALAGPMYLLYEVGLAVARLRHRRREL